MGWLSPTGSMRSQTHASASSEAATIDSRRSRVGSASAFIVIASCSASSAVERLADERRAAGAGA